MENNSKQNNPVTETLDRVDLDILRALQRDGRMTTRQLAAAVHRSPTPVFDRVRRLEKAGYIKGYMAVLDQQKLRSGLQVFCQVKIHQLTHDVAQEFIQMISELDEISEGYNVSGRYDYLLKVYAASMSDYRNFVMNKLTVFKSIDSIESTFVMAEIKRDLTIPL